MGGKVAVFVGHAAEIHDSSDTRRACGVGKGGRHRTFVLFEVGGCEKGVHQVIGNINTVDCLRDHGLIADVTVDRLDLIDPGVVAQTRDVAGEHTNAITVIEQLAHESTADVPRHPGDQTERGFVASSASDGKINREVAHHTSIVGLRPPPEAGAVSSPCAHAFRFPRSRSCSR